MNAELKINSLAYALARARQFMTREVEDLPMHDTAWTDQAQSVLADIEHALVGTLYEAIHTAIKIG